MKENEFLNPLLLENNDTIQKNKINITDSFDVHLKKQKLIERIMVKAKLENISTIGYVFNVTSEEKVGNIVNNQIQLMQGRTYYIPINTDINSDLYNIKILSEMAEKIDVRYTRDGFACVIPLRHNTTIQDDQNLCILTLSTK